MNISEQELLSMLEEAYKAGYEGYNEQMTAKCYSIVKKCKDEKSVSCGVDYTLGPSGTPLNWSNPYLSGTTDSAGPNRNGDDFSNVQINSIPENVTIQHIDGTTYTL